MYPYPSQWPSASIAYLLPILRGQPVADKAVAANAVWEIVGFGLERMLPPPPQLAAMSGDDVAKLLDHEHLRQLSAPGIAYGKLPWGQIIAILAELLAKWMANR